MDTEEPRGTFTDSGMFRSAVRLLRRALKSAALDVHEKFVEELLGLGAGVAHSGGGQVTGGAANAYILRAAMLLPPVARCVLESLRASGWTDREIAEEFIGMTREQALKRLAAGQPIVRTPRHREDAALQIARLVARRRRRWTGRHGRNRRAIEGAIAAAVRSTLRTAARAAVYSEDMEGDGR